MRSFCPLLAFATTAGQIAYTVRERLGVGEGDLRAVEVLSRKSQINK